jgi:hypothetical protein
MADWIRKVEGLMEIGIAIMPYVNYPNSELQLSTLSINTNIMFSSIRGVERSWSRYWPYAHALSNRTLSYAFTSDISD